MVGFLAVAGWLTFHLIIVVSFSFHPTNMVHIFLHIEIVHPICLLSVQSAMAMSWDLILDMETVCVSLLSSHKSDETQIVTISYAAVSATHPLPRLNIAARHPCDKVLQG